MGLSRAPVVRTILTASVLYGVFVVGLPVLILRLTDGISMLAAGIDRARWLGLALAGCGIYVYVWSAARLLRAGTSAVPGGQPTFLVTDGWYAVTRHPLLLGVVMILLGEAFFFSSWALLGYALTYWLWLTAFVVMKEEPDMRRTFGPHFDAYCRDVPRWIPRLSWPGGDDEAASGSTHGA